MPTDQEKVINPLFKETLDSLNKLTEKFATQKDVVDTISVLNKKVDKQDKQLADDIDKVDSKVTSVKSDLIDVDSKANDISSEIKNTKKELLSEIEKVKKMEGKPGKDGETPTTEQLTSLIKPLIPDPIKGDPGDIKDLSPDEIRDSLELLQGDERLDSSAIKGIDELGNRVKKIELRPESVGGGRGIQLYVDGVKKGLINTLNLIPGTNVTFTYAQMAGRNDLTISASGGSGVTSLLTVTGTVDDSNKSFTTTSTAKIVVINGASYVNGAGVTISGTNITTDNPVGTGGNIYAITF